MHNSWQAKRNETPRRIVAGLSRYYTIPMHVDMYEYHCRWKYKFRHAQTHILAYLPLTVCFPIYLALQLEAIHVAMCRCLRMVLTYEEVCGWCVDVYCAC